MMRILEYPSSDASDFLRRLAHRGGWEDEALLQSVRDTIARVRREGDAALLDITRQRDAVSGTFDRLRLAEEEVERAYAHVSAQFLEALRLAAANIRRFHERQRPNSWMTSDTDGVVLGQLFFPLERVGIFCPPRLFSSLLMIAIPARVAGVREIVAAIPPLSDGRIHPTMLVAARECGVEEIYAVSGVPAVAALAYGTETIRRVDKVTGPGGPHIQLAKKEVVGVVGIDRLAGPSEVLIIADDTAVPAWVAADLISQAEHGEHSSAILVTTDAGVAECVAQQMEARVSSLPRADLVRASVARYGGCLVVPDMEAAVRVANEVAPEHAEVHARDALQVAVRLRHAGAVFVGGHTPEAVGDYAAGPSHVLPTGGTARFYSSLAVQDFVKSTNLLAYTQPALDRVAEAVVTLAHAEQLDGHADAVVARRTDTS
jgi:histidinol dehydrogenase